MPIAQFCKINFGVTFQLMKKSQFFSGLVIKKRMAEIINARIKFFKVPGV